MASLRPRYATVREASALVRVPERVVRGMVVTGRVRAHRCGMQPWQVWVEDLEDVMREAASLPSHLFGHYPGVD